MDGDQGSQHELIGLGVQKPNPLAQSSGSTNPWESAPPGRPALGKPVPLSPPPNRGSPPQESNSSDVTTPGIGLSFSDRAAAAYFPPQNTSDYDAPTKPRSPPPAFETHDSYSPEPGSSFMTSADATPLFDTPKRGKHQRFDSQTRLLPLHSQTYPPPGGPMIGYLPPPVNIFQRYWLPHFNMYFLLVLGILFAAGHHVFYKSLDGRDATSQLKMLRYGATLSFLCKASLAAAVILAFRQRVWLTVRRKVMSLVAVDSLFSAAEDLTAIFNFEVFKNAKMAMLLAIYVWCTPLVVILTSETLAVHLATRVEETKCPSVRTLNFSHEETNDWRVGQKIDGLYELSVSWWNTTSANTDDPNWFDYYTSPSQQFEQVAMMSAFLGQPVVRQKAAEDICGAGWNCTYTVNFTGPGYKCTELASGVGSQPKDLGSAKAPFNTKILAPEGNFTYFSLAYRGEYADPQTDSGDAGIPNYKPPFPEHLGALRTEPIIWVGYAAVDDPTKNQPGDVSDPGWATAFTPKIFGCEHYETEYEVEFNYTGMAQTTTVKNRKFVKPIIDTTFVDTIARDGTLDNTTAIPEENYVLPRDLARYRRTAAYHSIGLQLRRFVNGTIMEPNKIVRTRASQTRLIDAHSYHGVSDLMGAVQSFYEDIILSMFSNPQFLAVVWATDPSKVTGNAKGDADTEYPCLRQRTTTTYFYHVADLWVVYVIAILFAAAAVAFGVLAVWDQGIMRDTKFSSIAAATRGPALEKVPWGPEGAVLGHARRLKVGYGILNHGRGDIGPNNFGFGVEGDVRQMYEAKRQTFRRA